MKLGFFCGLFYNSYMKKILIIGSCGAGKSTFAKRLYGLLGIEIIHLDQYYWKPNWTRTEGEEWQKKVNEFINKEQWIIDGNYRNTMDIRLSQADTIIWLDFLPAVCFYRILKRRFKSNRVDELDGCKERITFELLKWTLWTFPRINKKDIKKRLESSKKGKDIFVLKSNGDVELFLSNLKKKISP
jgi:adenylate kinase family enzyme